MSLPLITVPIPRMVEIYPEGRNILSTCTSVNNPERRAISYSRENGFALDLNKWTWKELTSGTLEVVFDGKNRHTICFKPILDKYSFVHEKIAEQSLATQRQLLEQDKERLGRSLSRSFEDILLEDGIQSYYAELKNAYTGFYDRFRKVVSLLPKPEKSVESSDFSSFYGKDIPSCNVQFIGAGKVHGFILYAAHSGKIHQLLKPTTEKEPREIRLEEDPGTIEKLIDYLYHKNVTPADDRQAQRLFHLAHKYEMPLLKACCREGALRADLEDADPSKIPSLPNKTGSLDNLRKTIDAAKLSIDTLKKTLCNYA